MHFNIQSDTSFPFIISFVFITSITIGNITVRKLAFF